MAAAALPPGLGRPLGLPGHRSPGGRHPARLPALVLRHDAAAHRRLRRAAAVAAALLPVVADGRPVAAGALLAAVRPAPAAAPERLFQRPQLPQDGAGLPAGAAGPGLVD